MWITRANNEETNLPIFFKNFDLKKEVKKCVMSITAKGIFSFKVNGIRTEDYFMPGWSNYKKYINLCQYDITDKLQANNCIEVTVANGWWSGNLGYNVGNCIYGEKTALYAELDIIFVDGTTEKILTDDSWGVTSSNILSADFFDGEKIDFTVCNVAYDAVQEKAVCIVDDTELQVYEYEPVRAIEKLLPERLYSTEKLIRLDFKQNFAGIISFDVKGKCGTTVTIKYAEVLCDNGELYTENLRTAKTTDTIILSADKVHFSPLFTYHGFRYAEIQIDGEATIDNIQGIVLSQNLEYNGCFHCSEEIVDSVYKIVNRGQKSNFISIPTDCPQRDERLGWTGDAQVFCNTAMFNCNCDKFFENYLKLIRTDAFPDGKIPSFVPFFVKQSPSTAGVPGWADSIITIPYYHYLHYRNKQVLIDNLPYSIAWAEYYLSHSKDYLVDMVNPFGDWLSVDKETDIQVLNQCLFGYSLLLLSRICEIVGQKLYAEKYQAAYQKSKEAFKANYYLNNKISGGTQTLYAIALSIGYVSKEEIKEDFVRSVVDRNKTFSTGFIGIQFILSSLCEVGEVDLAYDLIKQTEYPSLGYMIENGATTVWERWNGYSCEQGFYNPTMNSFNHYCLGSCTEWLYTHVLGIKLKEDTDEICIKPSFSKKMQYAEGGCDTPNGKIYVKWRYSNTSIFVEIIADRQVKYTYDFDGRKVLSFERKDNNLMVEIEA